MAWHSVKVVHGFRNGRKFGFPTANLLGESLNCIPPGVYAAVVKLDKQYYKGMLYVGTRPTLNLSDTTYEMHILDFDSDIYGKSFEFKIISYLRGEEHFSSVGELIRQLVCDKNETDRRVALDEYKNI